ncbi:aldehyde dehydrogenase family protein [Haloarcula marina]|uniref:2,5-dioxovalerate dehydrogenase n=1 Tax=Haloarcula marina TaxID=2961574 RepID=UPI0020B79B30|nr:aldehyde dehydrogenase family protein [Halomicroarcula marina]
MKFNNFVNGEWVPAATGTTTESYNPAATDEVVGEIPESTEADADAAISAAAGAEADWADTPGTARGALLRESAELLAQRKDELTGTLVREEGKAWSEAAGEVQRAIDIFYYYASKAADLGGEVMASSNQDTTLSTRLEPVGVVAAITPWNYPIAIPAWKVAPALAAGNTVVLKPATQTGVIANEFVRCLSDAGFPDGVVNLVTGPGSTVGNALATDDRVDAISFTGSETVGDIVYQNAASDQKRVQLEMGGKNPTLVTDSADVEEAVDIVANGAFGVTGQACTACSRAIVHEEIYEEFVETLVDRVESLEIGPGSNDPDVAPHVSEDELEGTLEYVQIGQNEGATLETGGQRLTGGVYDDGYYISPAVFSDVEPEMRIAQEEIFGPVLSVIPVSDFEEGIDVVNGVEQGLSASVVTDDLRQAHRFVDEADAGIVKTNEKTTGLEYHVPFGGMKASSSETFREQGDAGLDFYTISKTVYLNY